MYAKVVKIDGESLVFDDGSELYSNHESDCCEHHWLSFNDLTLADFDGLLFDLSGDKFFERIPDYGIALLPVNGQPVRIPGYGENNGYYSSELELILTTESGQSQFDISECQSINYE